MSKKYDSLYSLVEYDRAAREYFSSLPDYVQEAAASRSDNICSMDSLQGYVDSFLAGDK